MIKNSRFSKQEDNALIRKVTQDPSNLRKIFKEMEEETGRNWHSYEQRWYKKLSNPESKYYAGISLIALSKKRALVNRKNTSKVIPSKEVKIPLFSKVKNIIKRLFNLKK